MIKTCIFKEIGKYSRESGFFEMDYAKRFVEKNYVSTFLDLVVCRHIGKLTSEKNNDTTKNAYALNEVDQFGSSNSDKKHDTEKIIKEVKNNNEIICVNLQRRSDRKKEIITEFKNNAIDNYTFYNAIDGKKLCENLKITRLFKDNDFGNNDTGICWKIC
jgi:hypothetical protein